MGISGIFKELGAGERKALSAFSSAHYTTTDRPLRLAIDISIWLYQIQSGKGGSNPALRTFYYRLLRLLSLNIHPLFVFDGPNKPLYKRNKRVGNSGQDGRNGGYAKVSTVPEFLAKQLLKLFGFPLHVAPGEAEAECALLQRNGVVDAVLSEDVDTLMFGCTVTLRNWTAGEGSSTKTPTHVSVYRVAETKAKSGLDAEGMVLVALISGGDYLPDGVPGCGIKLACDAARAGFGHDLCSLLKQRRTATSDAVTEWRGRLQHEIRTNESKFFSRRLKEFTFPEDFPNMEVLGWYARPCVSNATRVEQLRSELKWDGSIDYNALRAFTADAFDWRNLGGAQKFIRNLAPAMLVRELRLRTDAANKNEEIEDRFEAEKVYIKAIHNKRNHASTDNELELRISFLPESLVPIDLSQEPEGDDFVAAGAVDSDDESEAPGAIPASEDEPGTPRKRKARPYDPGQKEKMWILADFVKLGCPVLVEEWEASFRDAEAFFQQRRKAKEVSKEGRKSRARKAKEARSDMPANALMRYATTSKAGSQPLTTEDKDDLEVVDLCEDVVGPVEPLAKLPPSTAPPSSKKTSSISTVTKSSHLHPPLQPTDPNILPTSIASGFRLPSSQQASCFDLTKPTATAKRQRIFRPIRKPSPSSQSAKLSTSISADNILPSTEFVPVEAEKRERFFAIFANPPIERTSVQPTTPKKQRKRSSPTLTSPSPAKSKGTTGGSRQESIFRYCSTTPQQPSKFRDAERQHGDAVEVMDLLEESETAPVIDLCSFESDAKRRRRQQGGLRKSLSAPVYGPSEGSRLEDGKDEGETTLVSDIPLDHNTDRPVVIDAESLDITASSDAIGFKENDTTPKPPSHTIPYYPVPPPTIISKPLPPPSIPTTIQARKNQSKKAISLRPSLPGTWKEVDLDVEVVASAETLDLTGREQMPASGRGKRSRKVQAWRKSGVEVLDLTED
ncbi:hypothetical protein K431DRAFT_280737 [Polychaeton citri CBS 116435]|uniref:PIN domain-like protein n=1 Tax=Polychaeton citri CBS 116435 TaxID=1314669 RepID=A0A9P4UVC0_9PEZI|nr:hypothetical protein K431DRAFT_280737 [Polychaeton citri CBS 116435]